MGGNRLPSSCLPVLLLLTASLVEGVIIKHPPQMVKQPPGSEELLIKVATRQNENQIPFIIECEAEGEPAPTYRWFKNGKEFDWQVFDDRISQQPGRGTLVIIRPRDEDIGQYQCFATNELGTASSNSVFVRKSELGSFSQSDPQVIEVAEGDPVGLTCSPPDGYPKPDVEWMLQHDRGSLQGIQSPRITVDPEGNLWFSNVTRQDESNHFMYSCSAVSYFRREYKIGNRVFLRVLQTGSNSVLTKKEPKQQYVSGKNTVVMRGKTLKLRCIYSGTPLPEIQWRKMNGTLPLGRVEYENYGKTLVISYVDFEDAGQYQCESTNEVGTAASYIMNVEVLSVPSFTVEPEHQNKAEGEVAEFHCNATGVPQPTIKWFYNGVHLDEAPFNPRRTADEYSVIIKNLTKADTGNYGCNFSSDIGYVYKEAYVNVLALPPVPITLPSDLRAVDGAEVNLTCRMFGAPKPRITWIKDGIELIGVRYITMDVGDLYIKEVSFADVGQYTCYARNKFGEEEAHGSLEVKERTRITQQPEDTEVRANNTATFRCNAVADAGLNLKIDWMVQEKKIDFVSDPRFIQKSDFSLSISKTTELDSGSYTCVASTEIDEIRASANLTVQDIPNAPRLLNVDCHDKDASVEWQPQGDNRAPILGYIIQQNTSFTPGTWENAFDSVPAATTKFTVNLSPWSNYTFRVIAINKIGQSLPSELSTVCTTPVAVPNKNPEGVEGKGSNRNNLVIKWLPMPEIDHNGPGFKYRVFWKRVDVPAATWNTNDVLDWQQDHYVVDNQPTFKQYEIKVEAYNELGQANVANPAVIGYSGEDVPSEAPKNLRIVGDPAATSATLEWEPVSNTSINGHFKGYKIQTWNEDRTKSKTRYIIVENNGETRAVIDSFVPFSKNFARVLVFNGAHDGPFSKVIDFVTPEGPPGPVDLLEAISMGSSGFLLTWKKPNRPNGILLGYHIYYKTISGTQMGPLSERDPPIRDPMITRAKLAGLKPGTKYRIIIRARTNAGEGSQYFIERTTGSSVAVMPERPSFIWEHMTDYNTSSIKMTWTHNKETNPGSDFYVEYRLSGEKNYEKTPIEPHKDYIILEGLQSNRTYQVRLVAVSQVEEIVTYV